MEVRLNAARRKIMDAVDVLDDAITQEAVRAAEQQLSGESAQKDSLLVEMLSALEFATYNGNGPAVCSGARFQDAVRGWITRANEALGRRPYQAQRDAAALELVGGEDRKVA